MLRFGTRLILAATKRYRLSKQGSKTLPTSTRKEYTGFAKAKAKKLGHSEFRKQFKKRELDNFLENRLPKVYRLPNGRIHKGLNDFMNKK